MEEIRVVLPRELQQLVGDLESAWNTSDERRGVAELKVERTPGKYSAGAATLLLIAALELVTKVGTAVVAAMIIKLINEEFEKRGSTERAEVLETRRLADGRELVVVKMLE